MIITPLSSLWCSRKTLQQLLTTMERAWSRYTHFIYFLATWLTAFKIQPTAAHITFPSDAAYILVGCLGGLGRSLTGFMRERGVQNFVFISRSGADKSDAAIVVKELRDSGASVDIHRADASDEAAVAKVITEVKKTRKIRGVVHAAMVLQVSLTALSF
jgi:hypothetical protein